MIVRRILLWSIAGVAVLALMVVATLYWASRSETMLRWGVDRFAGSLPCSLTVQGLHGSFMEPVNVQYVTCENTAFRLEARNIALVWSPWLLSDRRLDVTSLHIDSLTVASKQDNAQANASMQAPQDLRLPLAIDVASLRIGSLVAQSGDATAEFKAIEATYHADARGHRLALRNLESEWGRAAGEATIGTAAPLPMTAKLTVSTDRLEGWPVSADITLSGELQQINAVVAATIGELAATGELVLAPFDPEPVKSLTARTANIDAATFDSRLPHTALSATVQAKPVGVSALTGRVHAENAIPGRLDEQRLPAHMLDANFALDMDSLRLSDLHLDLGAAGKATGVAELATDRVTLALDVSDLDLQAARGDLRQTRLNGSINIDRHDDQQLVAVDLRQKDMQLEGSAEVTAQRIVVKRMTARAGGAQIRASAIVALDESLGFSLDGTLAGFDPSRFGDFPQANINGTLKARGRVRPEWNAAVEYHLERSRLAGIPLDGSGTFQLSPSRLQAADLRLNYGGNDLKLTGSFGERGDILLFALDAKRLDRFDDSASGKVQASGTLAGTTERPVIEADVKAQTLTYAGFGIGEATARISVEQADDPVIRGQANLRRFSRGEFTLDSVDANINGTLGNHAIEVAVAAPELQLAGRFEGGWDKAQRAWSGVAVQLENKGKYSFRMMNPAKIELAENRVLLGATKVEFSKTEIELGESRFQNGKLLTRGSVNGVRAARVLALMDKPPAVESTLVLSARWEIRADEAVDGFVEVSRTEGDIVIPGEEPLALGLKELRVTLRAVANQITADAILRSVQIDAQGSAQTRLEKRGAKWGVPGTAPLNLAGKLEMKSIGPLAALGSRAVAADGQLSLQVKGGGTIAAPRLSGNVEGNNLKIEHVANGVFLEQGVLRASFDDDALTLTEFRFKGGQGELTARGRFSARKGAPIMDLEWAARKLAVIQHPELRLTVSGTGRLGYKDATVSLKGELAADQGRVELRNRTFPALGDDVVIAGREERSQLAAETKRANLDLKLDLGPDFTIIGRGLDARMAGQIRLVSSADKPLSADGELRVASGTFEAYGRQLQIEQGALYFAGPVNNPGINIRAMRKNQPVEAGVEVTGTARDPRVRLVSDPEVPDPDKLAWLVLGRQAESRNTQDNRALQNSAVALAAGLGTMPLQRQLARSVGLDEINFIPGSGDSQNGVVAVGKQISDRIYVTQEFSTSAAATTLRVSYQLSRRWSVRTESGETDAVDLFFTFSFD